MGGRGGGEGAQPDCRIEWKGLMGVRVGEGGELEFNGGLRGLKVGGRRG